MRVRRLFIFLAFLMLLLLPVHNANCQVYLQYNVKINADGSAAWKITQVADINASIDTWEGFQQKVLDLIDSAASATSRNMTLNTDSLQIETLISSESKTTEFVFTWNNFSTIQNGEMSFGDVFRVTDFFTRLYGDASLQITLPSTYTVKSVSPEPNERDNRTQTLVWYRTQDFVSGQPSIVLTNNNAVDNGNGGGLQPYIVIGVASVLVGASIAGFLAFKRLRSNPKVAANPQQSATSLGESDEEKIINIIKSSGGTIRQSVVTEQSRFSKAKASQLLTALEQKGVVTRYKKGRDKIVTLSKKGVTGA